MQMVTPNKCKYSNEAHDWFSSLPEDARSAPAFTAVPTPSHLTPASRDGAAWLSIEGERDLFYWNVVFCDKHRASVKHTNPVHALYAPHSQLWKEALAIGKDILLMLLRGRVTSFNFYFFLEQWPFSHSCLGFCSLYTGATWLARIWRYSGCWVPKENSLRRPGDCEESAKCRLVLVAVLLCVCWRRNDGIWFWPAPYFRLVIG